jgi:tetratricopeptide (TPR) repeat protein
MRFLFPAAAVLVVVSVCASTASGQDPDIDRLLKKLPPPEKLVKTEIAPGIHRNDPIFQDPLGQEIQKAVTAGNYTRALAAARKLTERYPNSVVAQISRGSYALMSQQIGEASTAFRKATVLQPRLAMAHFGLGLAEGAQGRFSAAWPHLQKATQLEPGAVPAWIYLSACAERLGRKQESVRAARRATQLAPKSGPAWGQLARAEHASGNRTEALLAAGKAARFSPDLVTVTAAASVGALDIRRPVEGIRVLRRAIQLEPKNRLLRKQLQWFESLAAQASKTVARLEKRTAENPNSAKTWLELGAAYQQLERHDKARDAFGRAQRLTSTRKTGQQNSAAR